MLPSRLVSLLGVLSVCEALINHPHRVIRLPGAPLLPEFPLYAGFLNSSVDGHDQVFYMLNEAIRVDPLTAPLVIWFNGGPGGSSLSGAFTEHGPYRVREGGDRLEFHEHAWNQYANVLYLESPMGVGFSMPAEDGELTMDDEAAAELNYNALADLMTRVHDRYAARDFYLSGQSYAGAYVPHLARRLLRGIKDGHFANANFKGFAIGNPVLERLSRDLGQATQFLAYGLLPVDGEGFGDMVEYLSKSWQALDKGESDLEKHNEFHYHVYLNVTQQFGVNTPVNYNFALHCVNDEADDEIYHGEKERRPIACFAGKQLASYFNRMDVQTALHLANQSSLRKWSTINMQLGRNYRRDHDVQPVYKDIFELLNQTTTGFRVLVYHGDTDVMIPAVSTVFITHKIAKKNALERVLGAYWRFFDDYAGGRYSYRGGSVTMDVLTVRGSGHSVPTDAPAQAFQMINNFLFTEANQIVNYSKPIRKHW